MSKARDIARAGTALSSVDATELGYLDGVTSNIQTQFDNISGSKAQPTEPSTPTDGLVWLDTDGTAPTTVVTRWSKAPAAGTTSLSGNDDNNVPLSYSAGYEQVFLNGALLSRANDYTATSGTSITLTTGTVAGDIVEVICPLQISTTDTYTQTAANSVFVAKSENNPAGKNAVINGGMDIWQRGTSFTAADVYTADRWKKDSQTYSTMSRQTTSDTTNLPTIQYCARVARNSGQTGTSSLGIIYSAETADSIKFAGQSVIVSFWARAGANYSATSSALSYNFYTGTGTDQSRSFGVQFTREANIASSSKTLTTTWQRFSFTATVGATATELAIMFYFAGVGTAGANDYFEITGVQLELGSVATAFSRAGGTIQGELAACQRYYVRVNGDATNGGPLGVGVCTSTTGGLVSTSFPVPMRIAPTALEQNGTASDYSIRHGGGGTNSSAVPIIGNCNQYGATTNFIVASGLTAGYSSTIYASNNNTAYLLFTAEL